MFKKRILMTLMIGLVFLLTACNSQAAAPTESSASGGPILLERTTARDFADTALTEEQMDLLLQAAFSSATATGQRSWEFIFVTERERMSIIQEEHNFAQALDTAPLVIVIAMNEELTRYEEEFWLDAGIAAQSILIQATEMGLASVPMSIAPVPNRMEATARALDLPDEVKPFIMVAVGYPSSDTVTSASVDFYDEAKYHINSY